MDQAPGPRIMQELLGVPFVFNLLAVVISVIPFIFVSFAPMVERLKSYFPIRSFVIGALMNFFIVCHILFVKEKNEHEDSLFVAMMGMVLGTVSAFIWLLHDVASQASKWARFWMLVLMGALLSASCFLLHSMQVQLHLNKDKGWGFYIAALAGFLSVCLNGYPFVKAAFTKTVEPDYPVDAYGLFMCVLNTLDGSYFVVYAWYMGNIGTLLWFTSWATAVFGVCHLVILLYRLFAPLVEAADAFVASFISLLIAMVCVMIALLKYVPE